MSTSLLIYFASVADGFRDALFVAGLFLAVALLGLMIIYLDTGEPDFKKYPKWLAIALVFTSTTRAVIPDKTTVYLMASANVAEGILNYPETKELGEKIIKILNQKLDVELKDKT